jgi:hypothetical protein
MNLLNASIGPDPITEIDNVINIAIWYRNTKWIENLHECKDTSKHIGPTSSAWCSETCASN